MFVGLMYYVWGGYICSVGDKAPHDYFSNI